MATVYRGRERERGGYGGRSVDRSHRGNVRGWPHADTDRHIVAQRPRLLVTTATYLGAWLRHGAYPCVEEQDWKLAKVVVDTSQAVLSWLFDIGDSEKAKVYHARCGRRPSPRLRAAARSLSRRGAGWPEHRPRGDGVGGWTVQPHPLPASDLGIEPAGGRDAADTPRAA